MNSNHAMYSSQTSIISSDSHKEISGLRLQERKSLFEKRKIIADICFVVAVVGILLMIVDCEFSLTQVYGRLRKSHPMSYFMKSLISASTGVLIGLIIFYHILHVQLKMIEKDINDVRVACSLKVIFRLVLEVIVCSIHPIPGNIQLTWVSPKVADKQNWKVDKYFLDLTLSLLMFLRFYLLGRVLMFHSCIVQDTAAKSLGSLNRITFNFSFVFKTLMNLYPEQLMCCLIAFIILTASWMTRACEVMYDDGQGNFFNSLWLTAITFLSVGYGDIVPVSYCGRGIAVLTGMCGAGCTALMIAVLARKLEFTTSEKCVNDFVLEVDLEKQLKHAAANIIREAWLSHKFRRLAKTSQIVKHRRWLVKAISKVQRIKSEQRRLSESSFCLRDVHQTQLVQNSTLSQLQSNMRHLEILMLNVDRKLTFFSNHDVNKDSQTFVSTL